MTSWLTTVLLAGFTVNHETRMPEVPVPVPEVPADASADVVRGAWLYRVAACVGCHSPPFADAQHLGGGRDLPTQFGTFYAPNISPDPTVGIGGWSEQDFTRALRDGVSPTGRRYWPTFPYMTYTNMNDADLHALWAYVSTQPAVHTEEKPHEIRPRYRTPGLLGLWRTLEFRRGPMEPDPSQSEGWNRGRYLALGVAYCDQCHTPRNNLGLLERGRFMAGGTNPGKSAVHPNLTPDPTFGLSGWTPDGLTQFLSTGEKPDGTLADPDYIMAEKIHDSYAWLSEADRAAIAEYVFALPPVAYDPETGTGARHAPRSR